MWPNQLRWVFGSWQGSEQVSSHETRYSLQGISKYFHLKTQIVLEECQRVSMTLRVLGCEVAARVTPEGTLGVWEIEDKSPVELKSYKNEYWK